MTDELTNLNWLCSITTAKSLQQAQAAAVNSTVALGALQTAANNGLGRNGDENKKMKVLLPSTQPAPRLGVTQRRSYHSSAYSRPPHLTGASIFGAATTKGYYARPSCSYSCLIAMALKASTTGCLPVHEIYRFVEQEYPFYKTAPEGWKNSIRHNLSMNQNFVKVQRPDGFQTKKGYYWAANPTRQHVLDLEIERALKTMGRELIENSTRDLSGRQQLYHSSYDITSTVPVHSIESSESEELDDSVSSPALSDAPLLSFDNENETDTRRSLDSFNLVAGIKTQMGRHFPHLIKREPSSALNFHAIKNDSDALLELFGTSFNSEVSDQLKLNKQLAGTKRSSQMVPPATYFPSSKSPAVCSNEVESYFVEDHITDREEDDDTPDCIKPYFYCFDSVGYGKGDYYDDDDLNSKESLIKESDVLEDEELSEILKSCSPDSILLDGEEGEEEYEGTTVIITEDDGYLVMNRKPSLQQLHGDCPPEIHEICHELYTENPSVLSKLPDVSTKEKALHFITTDECQTTKVLPQLELNESEWIIPSDKIAMATLNDSDTKDIDFNEIANINN